MENSATVSECLAIDPSVYRLSAVKKAAYRMSARGNFEISTSATGEIKVVLGIRGTNEALDCLKKDFQRQLLDQELREEISEQTKPIAHLLLAQAFSATSLLDSAELADFRSDPANIAQPDRILELS